MFYTNNLFDAHQTTDAVSDPTRGFYSIRSIKLH